MIPRKDCSCFFYLDGDISLSMYTLHGSDCTPYHDITVLCTGPISARLSFAGSRHSCKFLLGLGTILNLLHHSKVLSTPSGAIICCFCGHFN